MNDLVHLGDLLGRGAGAQRYADKLRTIEWRTFAENRKRRANFTCQVCRQSGPTLELNIHHWFYESERLPWEYSDAETVVLCRGCHVAFHEVLKNFQRFVLSKMTPQSMRVLNGSLAAGLSVYEPLLLSHSIANLISNPGAVLRFGKPA